MIKLKRLLTITLMLVITLMFVSPSETHAYTSSKNLLSDQFEIRDGDEFTYKYAWDIELFDIEKGSNYQFSFIEGAKTGNGYMLQMSIGDGYSENLYPGDFNEDTIGGVHTYSWQISVPSEISDVAFNNRYLQFESDVLLTKDNYDEFVQLELNDSSFPTTIDKANDTYPSTWQLGTYINYGYDSGSATFNVIVPESIDGHNTSIPVRIKGTHETNTCVSFQSVDISDHTYSLGGIIDKDDYIELNVPINQVTYDEVNSRYVLDLQDLSWNGCASGSTVQAPTANIYVTVTGDMITPVIDGYNGVYVTNMDNPVTAEEIKALLTATDDLDGDITDSITIASDEYTSSFTTSEGVSESKNLLVPTITSPVVSNGITLTNDGNNTYTLNGQYTGSSSYLYIDLLNSDFAFDGTMNLTPLQSWYPEIDGNITVSMNYISGTIDGSGTSSRLRIYDESKINRVSALLGTGFNESSMAVSSNETFYIMLTVDDDHTFTNFKFNLQIEEGNSATEYTDYDTSVQFITPGDYDIDYSVTDAGGNTTTLTITVRVVDVTKPVINLLGETNTTIEVGSAWSDPGAVVVDNNDSNLAYTNANGYNLNALGNYEYMYNSVDSSGNVADPVIRYITVVDSTAPVVTLTGEETVTIEFGSNYTDPEATCSDNYDASCDVVVSGSYNIGALGSYDMTYTAIDSSGNNTAVTRTINVVDTTSPVFTGETEYTYNSGQGMTLSQIMNNITANDLYDSVLTDEIVIDSNEYNDQTNVLGTYEVSLSVIDSSGNTETMTITINIIDNNPPIFYITGDFMPIEEANAMTLQDYYDYFGIEN